MKHKQHKSTMSIRVFSITKFLLQDFKCLQRYCHYGSVFQQIKVTFALHLKNIYKGTIHT